MQDATVASRSGKKQTSKLQMILIFCLPFLAISLSYFMYFTGAFVPEGRVNNGELILPAKALARLGLVKNSQPFTEENLEGRWAILVIGSDYCKTDSCQQAMYQTRQAHIALGKETDRVVRGYIAKNDVNVSDDFRLEHPDVFWLSASEATLLKELNVNEWPASQYFIVDPLGNIMMGYEKEQYGGDLLKDLKRLLKASKIG